MPLNLHVQEFISEPRDEETLVMIHVNQTCICSRSSEAQHPVLEIVA